jgi:uncharacterized protein YqeY
MQSERPDLNLGSNLFYTQGADVPHGVLSYPAGRLTDLSNPAILDFYAIHLRTTHMSLRDRLTEDLKLAMKSRDQLRMDVIRMIKAAVLNKEVEIKKDLDDAEMSRVMTTLIKQRKEAAEQFEKGHRNDLAAKERLEINIIEAYLPPAVSDEDISRAVDIAVREAGAPSLKDMGAVMKAVMARFAGQTVDGKRVSDLVRAKLQS